MPVLKNKKRTYELDIGHFEVFFRKRYKLISILNDLSLGIWFSVGSLLFFWSATETLAIWLFLLGSIQLLGRPILKLIHAFYMKKDRYRKGSSVDIVAGKDSSNK